MGKTNKYEPTPKPGTKSVGLQVLRDITERIEFGFDKHKTLLQANNGRDALWDAYQEAIDLVMYLRQAIIERDGK